MGHRRPWLVSKASRIFKFLGGWMSRHLGQRQNGKSQRLLRLSHNQDRFQDERAKLFELDQEAIAGCWPACQEAVLNCFPDMCPGYLIKVAAQFKWDHEQIIVHVLDRQESGTPYPTRVKPSKRKWQDGDDKDAEQQQNNFEKDELRLVGKDGLYIHSYLRTARSLLAAAFPQIYALDIDTTLKENNNLLYRSYLALDKALSDQHAIPRFRTKKIIKTSDPDVILSRIALHAEKLAGAEFKAAKAACQAKRAQAATELDEQENMRRAKIEGTTTDCECCYDEYALNRMVHCDGEVLHWFCRNCARQMAETQIGLSKYQLSCMSMSGCRAGFGLGQRCLFLDDKSIVVLERLEQRAVLRMAGIENLTECPFCHFAAEYPPVEENREFKCEDLKCGIVSCRLCRQETHIPKSCEEAAREAGHSARHRIEEAMSEALIRKCNKCCTPFIKENGCNKMTCTAAGCHNVQCYVCSQSCSYTHFDDVTRGGKKGNCPLFDSVEQRHEDEVKAAEEKARKLVTEENPDVDSDMFTIKFSENVQADDRRRKEANPGLPAPRPNDLGFHHRMHPHHHHVIGQPVQPDQPPQVHQVRQFHQAPQPPQLPQHVLPPHVQLVNAPQHDPPAVGVGRPISLVLPNQQLEFLAGAQQRLLRPLNALGVGARVQQWIGQGQPQLQVGLGPNQPPPPIHAQPYGLQGAPNGAVQAMVAHPGGPANMKRPPHQPVLLGRSGPIVNGGHGVGVVPGLPVVDLAGNAPYRPAPYQYPH